MARATSTAKFNPGVNKRQSNISILMSKVKMNSFFQSVSRRLRAFAFSIFVSINEHQVRVWEGIYITCPIVK